jgi:hypothetical protein
MYACICLSLVADPKIHRSTFRSREEVAPISAEDVASCSDAPPNPALNSVVVSAGDLLSAVCRWSTTGLVEDVLLVGAEGADETQGAEVV